MSSIEKLEAIKAFEDRHDVTAYLADGWHVWPLVRILLGFNAFPLKAPSVLERIWAGLFRPVAGYFRALLRQSIRTGNTTDKKSSPASVVFLTQSGRRVWWRECFYEIYTDPLVEILRSMDEPVIVWEAGEKKVPQCSPSHHISTEVVDELYRSFSHARRLPEPGWFSHLQPLFLQIVGRPLKWSEICDHIVLVTEMANIFERKLRNIRPKVIIEICWYSNRAMALTMAARRLDIKTVDLQHGVQGKGHFAYSGWQKFPAQGYEVMPDLFWCWGQASVGDLMAYNPGLQDSDRFLIGGNPWLNKWRPSVFEHRVSDPQRKTVLVTLQHEVSGILLDGIRKSPKSWKWMIRFHPARSPKDRESDCALFASTGHEGVEIDRKKNSLLYKFLQECDVHITEASTCALEALPFGVSTVVLADTAYGRIGCFYFLSYIERDVMRVAHTADELLAMVLSMPRLASTLEVGSQYFADSAESPKALGHLLGKEGDLGAALNAVKGDRE